LRFWTREAGVGATLVSSVASLILISILGFRYGASGCAAGSSPVGDGLISYWPAFENWDSMEMQLGCWLRLQSGSWRGSFCAGSWSRDWDLRDSLRGSLCANGGSFAALRFGYVTTREKNQLGELPVNRGLADFSLHETASPRLTGSSPS